MTDRAQVNLKLPEEQKKRWRKAAENDPEYTSLSQLVRQAVERELAGGQAPAGSGADSETVDQIRETVERNHDALTGLRSIVSSIEKATDATGDDRRARAEVWSFLPEDGGLTPSEIADELGGPFTATSVAALLEAMADDGHVTTHDGTHYRRAE